MSRRMLCGGMLIAVMLLLFCGEVAASDLVPSSLIPPSGLSWSLLAGFLVFLIPGGLTMVAAGASEPENAPRVAAAGLIAIALGVIVYALIGFGFQFGGLGLISDVQGAEGLVSEWSPVDRIWGPGWGIIGLDGFLLLKDTPDAELLTVFLYQAALAATAVCIPLLALARRLKFFTLLGVGLLCAILIYPIYGNWGWGGGWLSQLGVNLGLGHGLVDFAGSGMVHALGGFVALAAILVLGTRVQGGEEPVKPPPVHFPLVAQVGVFLLLLGWIGLAAGNPLVIHNVSFAQILVNVLLAACGGILFGALYIWFATGSPDLLMIVRCMVGALVAVSASCAFVPPWAALVIGGLAGLLLPVTIYALEVRVGLDDLTGAVSTHGVCGLWGLLALAIFADGGSGQGWNGVGQGEYLSIPGQGVSGLLVKPGFQPDWPHQLYAQMVGTVALIALALVASWLVFRGVDRLVRGSEALRSQVDQIREPSLKEK